MCMYSLSFCNHLIRMWGTTNPMHSEPRKRPSAAYMESYRRAQEARQREGIDGPQRDPVPGWRTLATATLCLVVGMILFIIGAVYRWTSDGTEKHNQGMDLLIVGGILLLPGSYTCWILLGAFLGWPGYFYRQVPSMDTPLTTFE